MARFQADYGLSEEDSAILTTMRETADYLDEAVKAGADAKTAANWMLGDLSKMVNEANITFADAKVKPAQLAAMIELINKGTISGKIAKKLSFPCGKPVKIRKLSLKNKVLFRLPIPALLKKS